MATRQLAKVVIETLPAAPKRTVVCFLKKSLITAFDRP